MTNPILLDTHTLLWSVLKPDELSKNIQDIILTAQKNNQLLICSISLWEIAMLKLKKRINIYEPVKDFLDSLTKIKGLSIKEISSEIASESIALMDDFHGDPADRIIVSTARCHGATLLTRDRKILAWAKFGHIKTIEV